MGGGGGGGGSSHQAGPTGDWWEEEEEEHNVTVTLGLTVTVRAVTSSSLIATQLCLGNPWSIGTKNWRQPDQWPTSNIMHIRLKIRMKTLAMLRN